MADQNQVDLVTAIKWVNAWRALPSVQCSSFIASYIPMIDVIRIQNETGAVALRAYNGYDADNNKYKLLLVGIDDTGDDIIELAALSDSKIYDLTLPCPDTCNVNSPLFTGHAVAQE